MNPPLLKVRNPYRGRLKNCLRGATNRILQTFATMTSTATPALTGLDLATAGLRREQTRRELTSLCDRPRVRESDRRGHGPGPPEADD